jgi:hypothetical protein
VYLPLSAGVTTTIVGEGKNRKIAIFRGSEMVGGDRHLSRDVISGVMIGKF